MSTLALLYKSFWWREILHKTVSRIMAQRQEYGVSNSIVLDSAKVYNGGLRPIIIARCPFVAPDGTLITVYPWTNPEDIRPGINQWSRAGWLGGTENIQVFNNKAEVVSGGAGLYDIFYIPVGVNTYTSVVDARIGLAGTIQGALCWRVQDGNNNFAGIVQRGTKNIFIYEMTGGAPALRASGLAASNFLDGVVYTFTLSLTATSMSFSGNGGTASFNSASKNANLNSGILTNEIAAQASRQSFDNFKVTVP